MAAAGNFYFCGITIGFVIITKIASGIRIILVVNDFVPAAIIVTIKVIFIIIEVRIVIYLGG